MSGPENNIPDIRKKKNKKIYRRGRKRPKRQVRLNEVKMKLCYQLIDMKGGLFWSEVSSRLGRVTVLMWIR